MSLTFYLIIVLIIWQGFFPEVKVSTENKKVFVRLKKIEINFQALKTPFLKELQPFEQAPVFEGEIGRENPFIPY